MLNRRFLRIKAFQALYSYSREEGADAQAYRRKMLQGLDKTYELYLFLLSYLCTFNDFLEQELEAEKAKFIPSPEAIQLLEACKDNPVVQLLQGNASYKEAIAKNKIVWTQHQDLFRQLWSELKAHPLVKAYAASKTHTLAEAKQFSAGLLEWVCANNELFEAYLEERYLNWEDDQVLVLTTLQRTLQMLKENSSKILPEKHKDEKEDIKFLKDLFDLCLTHDAALMELISARTKNWDQDRIALVDLILMKMAICEVLYFPYVPVKVSINEYLELAKLYSTPNSHGFINGVLDKVQIDLKKENKINKQGRGLVD